MAGAASSAPGPEPAARSDGEGRAAAAADSRVKSALPTWLRAFWIAAITVPRSTAERAGLVRCAAMPKSSTMRPKSIWSTEVRSTIGMEAVLVSEHIALATSAPFMPGIW